MQMPQRAAPHRVPSRAMRLTDGPCVAMPDTRARPSRRAPRCRCSCSSSLPGLRAPTRTPWTSTSRRAVRRSRAAQGRLGRAIGRRFDDARRPVCPGRRAVGGRRVPAKARRPGGDTAQGRRGGQGGGTGGEEDRRSTAHEVKRQAWEAAGSQAEQRLSRAARGTARCHCTLPLHAAIELDAATELDGR